jgi:hypothetical protein
VKFFARLLLSKNACGKFIQFGETIEYELFKGNKAKHSPHQRALHLKYFTICNNNEELRLTLLKKINSLKLGN